MSEPRVAVIVPTWRRRHALQLLYLAFKDQIHRNWKLFLAHVDPADSVPLIDKRACPDPRELLDPRIVPVLSLVQGSSAQRNHGLHFALGDPEVKYVAFFDDDDIPFPDYLSVLVSVLEKNPKARAASCDVMDPHRGRLWRKERDAKGFPKFEPIHGTTPGFLYRRDVAKPVWDSKGWFQNARYSTAVLGPGHDHRGDVHVDRVLVCLLRDLAGGLHHSAGVF